MRPGTAAKPFPDRSNHIGSKDFPMPGKNSSGKLPRSGFPLLFDDVGFELCGRYVAERGVKPRPIVDLLEKLAD